MKVSWVRGTMSQPTSIMRSMPPLESRRFAGVMLLQAIHAWKQSLASSISCSAVHRWPPPSPVMQYTPAGISLQ